MYNADKNYNKGGVQTGRTSHNAKMVDLLGRPNNHKSNDMCLTTIIK